MTDTITLPITSATKRINYYFSYNVLIKVMYNVNYQLNKGNNVFIHYLSQLIINAID